jgi:hypothetical protein
VISDPARMKEGLINQPLVKQRHAVWFQERAESYYEHERYELSIGYDFINMSKEVVAVRSLKPGNFETSVEGVRY